MLLLASLTPMETDAGGFMEADDVPADSAARPRAEDRREVSTVRLTMKLNLGKPVLELDQALPSQGREPGPWNEEVKWEPHTHWLPVKKDEPIEQAGWKYRFRWDRKPIAPDFEGDDLKLATSYRYGVQVLYHAIVWHGTECGLFGKDPAQGHLSAKVHLGVDTAFNLQAAFNRDSDIASTSSACDIRAILELVQVLDVGKRIPALLRQVLADRIETVVLPAIRRISLRGPAEGIWARLLEDVAIGRFAVLRINPQGLRVERIVGTGQTATVTLGLAAYPELRSRAFPEAPKSVPLDWYNEPLPPGFHIHTESILRYQDIVEALLDGRPAPIGLGGQNVQVEDITLRGLPGGRMLAQFGCAGAVSATLSLSGKPEIDKSSQTFFISDLDFNLDTENLLLETYAWVNRAYLKEKLSALLRIGLRERYSEFRAAFNKELRSRRLDSAELKIELDDLVVLGVRADPEELRVQVRLDGRAEIEFAQMDF